MLGFYTIQALKNFLIFFIFEIVPDFWNRTCQAVIYRYPRGGFFFETPTRRFFFVKDTRQERRKIYYMFWKATEWNVQTP